MRQHGHARRREVRTDHSAAARTGSSHPDRERSTPAVPAITTRPVARTSGVA